MWKTMAKVSVYRQITPVENVGDISWLKRK
jgi:hypothetical protein